MRDHPTSGMPLTRRLSIGGPFASSRLLVAGAVAVIASAAATLVIREVTVGLVDVPTSFSPLRLSSALFLTVVGAVAATAACFALNARAKDPVRLFSIVAPIALVVSFVPDVAIWVGGAYGGTARASTVLPLMVMHVAVGTICLIVLPALGAERRPRVTARVATGT